MIMKKSQLILIALTISFTISVNEYHVAKTGNDKNKETLNSPFLTIQTATQWAPPTAEKIGLVGTNWSKGWIIENNIISNSRCTGITLGKDRKSGNNVGDIADKGRVPDGLNLYNDVIDIAFKQGWNKGLIGSHIVRNN